MFANKLLLRILTADQGVSVLSSPRKLPPCGVDTPALPPLLALSVGEGSVSLTGWDENTGRLHRRPPLLLAGGGTCERERQVSSELLFILVQMLPLKWTLSVSVILEFKVVLMYCYWSKPVQM